MQSLAGSHLGKSSSDVDNDDFSIEEYMQRKIDRYNNSDGTLNAIDGYECKLCRNRGYTATLIHDATGICEGRIPCKCIQIRSSIARLKRSGLEKIIKDKTLETFNVKEDWQRDMLNIAKRYIDEGVINGKWMFFGGAVGCGKTHICTATAGKLLYKMPVYYIMWTDMIDKLKASANDMEEYSDIITPLKKVEVLYIDDLFKPAIDRNGNFEPPSTADIRRTYDLLNYRYINNLATIISSERYMSELIDIDDAIGSRIAERSKYYCMTIRRDRKKNQRLVDLI